MKSQNEIFWRDLERESLENEKSLLLQFIEDSKEEEKFANEKNIYLYREERELFNQKILLLDHKLIQLKLDIQPVSPTKELNNIQDELQLYYQEFKDYFGEAAVENLSIHNEHLPYFYPRIKFLLQRRDYLEKKHRERSERESHEKRSLFSRLFNLLKKPIDFLDTLGDILRAAIHAIPSIVPLIIAGASSFLILFGEAFESLKELRKNHKEKKSIGKVNGVTLGLSILFGVGGGILGVFTLIGAVLGVSTIGALTLPILPFVLGSVFVAIYGLSTYRFINELNQLKVKEKALKIKHQNEIDLIEQEIHSLKVKKLNLKQEQSEILHDQKKLLSRKSDLTDHQILLHNEDIFIRQKLLNERYKNIDQQESDLIKKMDSIHLPLSEVRATRMAVERKLAFNLIEVGGSVLIAVGLTLITTAFFAAASIASFGILPAALIITGALIGIASKLFEAVDEKKHFAHTQWMRTTIAEKWNNLTQKNKNKNTLMEEARPHLPQNKKEILIESHERHSNTQVLSELKIVKALHLEEANHPHPSTSTFFSHKMLSSSQHVDSSSDSKSDTDSDSGVHPGFKKD